MVYCALVSNGVRQGGVMCALIVVLSKKPRSFDSSRPNNKFKNKKSKKWFDNDCKSMRNQLAKTSRLIRCNKNNFNLLNSYRKQRKKYFKLLQQKKRSFKDNIFNKLEKLESNDPKSFWKLFNELTSFEKQNSKINEQDNEKIKLFKRI